ncbi:MAG: DUF4139 domain-containing protein [archaeon]|nr:DUF4139 domain-containing protein [archaeon]
MKEKISKFKLKGISKSAITVVLLLLIVGSYAAFSAAPKEVTFKSSAESVDVTVYNSDLGVVKEVRTEELDAGHNMVYFKGVASQIDPTSVHFKDLTYPKSIVLEQNYEYDLVSKEKLFQKYIDREITIRINNGDRTETKTGTLLSHSGNQVILKDASGKILILNADEVELPALPKGLITQPTLKWLVNSAATGNHSIELSYMTGGMNWNANYVAVVDKDDKKTDLTGWVTVNNNAGTTFENARLKLVAGDVHRVQKAIPAPRAMYDIAEEKAEGGQFQEEQLFEYHMYTLQRPTTLQNNQQKQVTLFNAPDVSVVKEFVFDPARRYYWQSSDSTKINVMLNLRNSEENGMGLPLPKGTVRVYKKDSEGKLQFIGEDSIDHTPKDEEIRLYLGNAFDLVGEKKQTKYTRISDHVSETSYEVELRNHKDEDVYINVIEHPYGDWEVTATSDPYDKKSTNKLQWTLKVPKDGTKTLTYTIRTRW